MHRRPALRLALTLSSTALLGGCTVLNVAGAAAGTALAVGGAVVTTGVKVTGAVVSAGAQALGGHRHDEAAQASVTVEEPRVEAPPEPLPEAAADASSPQAAPTPPAADGLPAPADA